MSQRCQPQLELISHVSQGKGCRHLGVPNKCNILHHFYVLSRKSKVHRDTDALLLFIQNFTCVIRLSLLCSWGMIFTKLWIGLAGVECEGYANIKE